MTGGSKATRKPLRGFPKTLTFKTKEEVDAYFDNDELLCLLCGYTYQSLHNHLRLTHECSADDYREMFGLPWRRGLAGKKLKRKLRKIMNRQRKEGILPHSPSPEHLEKLRESIKNRRPSTDVAKNSWQRHALRTHGREVKWAKKDFEEFLARIKTGRTISEVGKDEDMPCREVFAEYVNDHPAFRKKFEQAWDRLPFSVQVRGNRLGLRFEKDLKKLRERGLSQPEIARKLGVSLAVVRGRLNGQGRQKTQNIALFLETMDKNLRTIKLRDTSKIRKRPKKTEKPPKKK